MSDPQTDELVATFYALPPMKRLFFRQQLMEISRGNSSAFDGSLSASEMTEAYEAWLSEFDPSVIEAFESGRWEVSL